MDCKPQIPEPPETTHAQIGMIGFFKFKGSDHPLNGAKVEKIGDWKDGKVLFKFLDGDRKDQEGAIEPQFIEFQAQDSNEVDKVENIEQTQPAANLSELMKKV